MIDQDYAELLGRSPPTGDLLEWTFPGSALSNAFVSLLIGTPALCLALYVAAGEGDDIGGSVEFRIPTLTRLSIRDNPIGDVFTGGMHLAAAMAIPLFWCVKLSHHQRLQARTGVTRYDLQAEDAVWWVRTAWIVGTLGAALLYAAASVPGEKKGDSSSAQSVTHLVLYLLAACGLIGQAACTAWALRKARRVFVVSEADLVAYRRKIWLASAAVVAAVVAVSSVLLVECFADGACGVGYVHSSASWGGGSSGDGGGNMSSVFLGESGGASFIAGGSGCDGGSSRSLISDDSGVVTSVVGGGADGVSSSSSGGGGGRSERAELLGGDMDSSTATAGDSGPANGATATNAVAAAAAAARAVVVRTRAPIPSITTTSSSSSSGSSRRKRRKRRDCNTEWCYSRSLMGLWEWLLLLLEAGFCVTLRHDLAPATAGVGVESFVL